MKLVATLKQDLELSNQLLELDESEHDDLKLREMLNLQNMAEYVDKYVYFFEMAEKRIEFIDDYISQLNAMKKAVNARVLFVKNAIKHEMIDLGIESVLGYTKKINLQNSQQKLVIDESKIAACYKKETIVLSTDKEKVLADLVRGESVEGAFLEQGQHIRTYKNSSNKTALIIRKEDKDGKGNKG